MPDMIFTEFSDNQTRINNNLGKILIVDDEKFNCDIILGFLLILGIHNRREMADLAYNGKQAVELVQKAIDEKDPHRYRLILMDCNMPFMDGYETA